MKKNTLLLVAFFCLGIGATKAQYTILHNFHFYIGTSPYGSLICSGKVLYGTTIGGGANNYGCVFSIDTNGRGYKDLLDFNGTNG